MQKIHFLGQRVEDPGPISTILTVINYWSIIPIYLIQKYPNPEFQDVRANISKDKGLFKL